MVCTNNAITLLLLFWQKDHMLPLEECETEKEGMEEKKKERERQ